MSTLKEERKLNTSKRYIYMYMIESWEIETKMYKKEDHFPVNFNTFLFWHVYLAINTFTVFKLLKYTEAWELIV